MKKVRCFLVLMVLSASSCDISVCCPSSAAIEMLEKQHEQSLEKIAELNEDLDHLRANSITVEVNMARLFNYNVKMKKMAAAGTAGAGGEAESKS